MKHLKLPIHNIVITFNENDKSQATITSDMDKRWGGDELHLCSVRTLEMTILNMFKAGCQIGHRDIYTAIDNTLNSISEQHSYTMPANSIMVTDYHCTTSLCDETRTYSVDKASWNEALLACNGNTTEALETIKNEEDLNHEGILHCIEYKATIQSKEHDEDRAIIVKDL